MGAHAHADCSSPAFCSDRRLEGRCVSSAITTAVLGCSVFQSMEGMARLYPWMLLWEILQLFEMMALKESVSTNSELHGKAHVQWLVKPRRGMWHSLRSRSSEILPTAVSPSSHGCQPSHLRYPRGWEENSDPLVGKKGSGSREAILGSTMRCRELFMANVVTSSNPLDGSLQCALPAGNQSLVL